MAAKERSEQQPKSLNDVLAAGRLRPDRAKTFARQIAEELCAAHEHGLAHGALNPSNVLLLGSNNHERAVISGFALKAKAASDLKSDIYAFGQLLEAMIPGHRLAYECMASNLGDRPGSFDLVLEELQDLSARRTWIGTLLIGAAAASLFFYELSGIHAAIQ